MSDCAAGIEVAILRKANPHVALENSFLTKSTFCASTIIFKCVAYLTRFPAKIVYAFRATLIRNNLHMHRSATCFISALLVTAVLILQVTYG